MRLLTIVGWILLALEGMFVAGLFLQRNMGDDAAGRGMATGYAIFLTPPVLIAAALLFWGSRGGPRLACFAGVLIAGAPVIYYAAGAGRNFLTRMSRLSSHAYRSHREGRFDDTRLTTLAQLLEKNDFAAARALLSKGPVDFKARDREGRTLLGHLVRRSGESEADSMAVERIRLVLDAGVRPSPTEMAAARMQQEADVENLAAWLVGRPGPVTLEILDLLLTAGLDPNVDRPDDGLLINSTYMRIETLEVLARHGVNFAALDTRTDRLGWTAAMIRADGGEFAMALWFLDHGAPVDHVAPDGRSLAGIMAKQAELFESADPQDRYTQEYLALKQRLRAGP